MDALQSLDLNILNFIQNNLRCAILDYFIVFLNYLTTYGIIWIAAGVVLLFFRKTRAAGIILLSALTLGFLTGDVLLKHLIDRPRPFTVNTDFVLMIKQPSGASFPSTHSILAAASTTVLLAKDKRFGIVAFILTLCIAFSRLYLYVHYPTDVFCGLLLGVICGITMLLIARAVKLENRLSKSPDN